MLMNVNMTDVMVAKMTPSTPSVATRCEQGRKDYMNSRGALSCLVRIVGMVEIMIDDR